MTGISIAIGDTVVGYSCYTITITAHAVDHIDTGIGIITSLLSSEEEEEEEIFKARSRRTMK